ncbi:ANTAR domain-containing protein [Frankia sp. AiPs1]|uniref:Rho termination factor N-terminal domain-containing protein n=1 Tax=Frankia sp. AiPa1 TaxID=573492 RepID=UPI00202B0871|nr:Rho termination factor N-terminal domain-containing protein [Frankia sp. AiPa1]MCL9761635.1 Rho termination factor N-terminal domain-containing protein [Frankia sp. AiPa1]
MPESAADLAALVLHHVARLVAELTPTQVRDLTAGRARLTVVEALATNVLPAPAAGKRPQTPATGSATGPVTGSATGSATGPATGSASGDRLDPGQVRAALLARPSREDAAGYAAGLGTVPELRALAAGLGVRIPAKARKDDIARSIVDATLGARLTSQAMRDGGTR